MNGTSAKQLPIKLTRESVLEVLEAAVQARGEGYIYTDEYDTCQYVINPYKSQPEPGCLVGEALYRLGVPLEAMEDNAAADRLLDRLRALHIVSYRGESVVNGLLTAQQRQDSGTPWGAAVDAAKKILR